jgi:hypothetical protein
MKSVFAPNGGQSVCSHARIVAVSSREIQFSAEAHIPAFFSFGRKGGKFFGVEVTYVVIVGFGGDEF